MAGGTVPGPINDLGAPMRIDSGTLALTENAPPGVIGLDTGGGGGTRPAALGDKVVAAAQQRVGTKVGSGECFDLADQALRAAGAKSAGDFRPVVPDDDYVWGTTTSRADVKPGDVIQLRDFHVEIKVTTEKPNGGADIVTNVEDRPHHTAIVTAVGADGVLTVLEQNFPGGASVHSSRLHLADSTATVGKVTTEVTVTGSFWIYRPQPK